MTKQEALQKFASHVDVPGLKSDFPEIDWVVTELDDGQQEIIIRLQGEDVDFRPGADYAVIDALEMKDIPDAVKNSITLRRHKRLITRNRRDRFENAIFRRIKALIAPAGISVHRLIKILKRHLPVVEVEL
jgi:hypothetical protein